MADTKKKSQAQKVASGKAAKKSTTTKTRSTAKAKEEETRVRIPTRLVTSVICLGLFLVFLVMALQPEGALISWFLTFA